VGAATLHFCGAVAAGLANQSLKLRRMARAGRQMQAKVAQRQLRVNNPLL
jgi:hypothetical protein